MTNPTYLVNIFYQPARVDGQQLVSISGVTQSIPTYSGSYFIASMPEVKVTATGSSYTDALNNLLSTVSSTTDPGNGALNNIRTY